MASSEADWKMKLHLSIANNDLTLMSEETITSIKEVADVNIPDQFGTTLLMYAVQREDQEVVEILLKKRANPNQSCNVYIEGVKKQMTPLEYARNAALQDVLGDAVDKAKWNLQECLKRTARARLSAVVSNGQWLSPDRIDKLPDGMVNRNDYNQRYHQTLLMHVLECGQEVVQLNSF